MTAAVVSIAAGEGQIPLLRAARALGFAVIAVDRDVDAPGLAFADEAILCSTHDAEAVIRGLVPLRGAYDLAAIATKSSGVPVATAARVARALGLRGLDPDGAQRAVTKPGTMQLAARAGVPTPRHFAVGTFEEFAARGVPPPLVFKPSLTVVGKAGVALVREEHELAARFAEAHAAAADGVVEVEEYVAGSDTAVLGLFDAEGFQTLALVDEDTRFTPEGAARGFGFAMPSAHQGTAVDHRLVGLAARFVEANALGTGYGAFTFRVGLDGAPKLIEVHLDLAGDFVADRLLPAATGLDLLGATLLHLAGTASPPPRPPVLPAAVRFVFAGDLAAGRAAKVAALGALRADCEVDLGIAATGVGDDRRVGCVLLRAETAVELASLSRTMDHILGRGSRR